MTPSPEAVALANELMIKSGLYQRAGVWPEDLSKPAQRIQSVIGIQTASLRKRAEELELMNLDMEIRLSLWSSTIQRYQSWKANNVPDRDYPNAIIADYERLSQFPATKSELLEEVVAALKFESERDACFCDEVKMECVPCRAKRLLKRLTPQP